MDREQIIQDAINDIVALPPECDCIINDCGAHITRLANRYEPDGKERFIFDSEPPISPEERREIGNAMIERWRKWMSK